MAVDNFLMVQADREAAIKEEDRQSARLVVAGLAKDNNDCLMLLQALGLVDE
jgi:hypothetical protein